MNTNARTFLDQADYQSANTALESSIVVLESQLRATGQTVPPRPAYERGNVIAANDALTAHKATLQGKLSIGAKAPAQTAEPKTLTEKVLAAKGVKTLAELNAKMLTRGHIAGD